MDDPSFVLDYDSNRVGYCKGLIRGFVFAASDVCPGENVSFGQPKRRTPKTWNALKRRDVRLSQSAAAVSLSQVSTA